MKATELAKLYKENYRSKQRTRLHQTLRYVFSSCTSAASNGFSYAKFPLFSDDIADRAGDILRRLGYRIYRNETTIVIHFV